MTLTQGQISVGLSRLYYKGGDDTVRYVRTQDDAQLSVCPTAYGAISDCVSRPNFPHVSGVNYYTYLVASDRNGIMAWQLRATSAAAYTAYAAKSDAQMKNWTNPYNIASFCTASGGVRGIYSCGDEWFLAYYTNSNSTSSSKIRSTKNGVSWTREVSASGMTIDGVVKFNGMYILMGSNGWTTTPIIRRYTTNWVPIGAAEEPWDGRSCECCFVVNGVMCALENSYNNSLSRLFVSMDGYTFTPITISSTGAIIEYAHNSKSGMVLYSSNGRFRIYDGTTLSSYIYPPTSLSDSSYTNIRVDYMDGTILLTTPDYNNKCVYVYVSHDNGSHWTEQTLSMTSTVHHDTRDWTSYNNAVAMLSDIDHISLVTPTSSNITVGSSSIYV